MFVVLQNVEYNRNVQCAKKQYKERCREMGFTDETVRFDFDDSRKKEISETLAIVYRALEEKGYNPINQILGYLISGDPAYITSYNNARSDIRRLERDDLIEELLKEYAKAKQL